MGDRIPVKTITITRAEGPSHLCDRPLTVTSWALANAVLMGNSATAPEKGGYDKHDFKVVFEDGQEYSGRYDLVHHRVELPRLDRHVLDFCGFMAGWKKPAHLSDEAWERTKRTTISRFEQATVDNFRQLLRAYDIPGADSIVPALETA